MNSKEFVFNWISKTVMKFNMLKLSYRFDLYNETHLIEVIPQSEYSENNIYIKAESKFIDQFNRKFENESVCFITSESLVSLGEPEAIWMGDKFNGVFDLNLLSKIPESLIDFLNNYTYPLSGKYSLEEIGPKIDPFNNDCSIKLFSASLQSKDSPELESKTKQGTEVNWLPYAA